MFRKDSSEYVHPVTPAHNSYVLWMKRKNFCPFSLSLSVFSLSPVYYSNEQDEYNFVAIAIKSTFMEFPWPVGSTLVSRISGEIQTTFTFNHCELEFFLQFVSLSKLVGYFWGISELDSGAKSDCCNADNFSAGIFFLPFSFEYILFPNT